MKKKIFGIFITLIMVVNLVGVVPIGTVSATTSGICGNGVKWSYNASNETLTISGTGSMNNYTFENHENIPWQKYCAFIKSVEIQNGVTSIGDWTFSYFEKLTYISIPSSVKSIGEHAFYCCNNLTSVTIPKTITSIGKLAFADCEKLKRVKILNSSMNVNDFVFTSTPWLKNKIKKQIKNVAVKKIKTASKKGKIIVSWKKSKAAEGYEIEVSTSKKFKKKSVVAHWSVSNNKRKCVVKNQNVKGEKAFTNGKTYYVRIRAYKVFPFQSFGMQINGKWSKIKKVKVK